MIKNRLNKWKLKAIISSAILIIYIINRNLFVYLLSIIGLSKINEVKSYINYYSKLETLDSKISLLPKFKKNIYKMFMKKNINNKTKNVNSIYVDVDFRFGNLISFLNKLLYYCEIIKCKFIILNEKKFWFIDKTINIKYQNMTIMKGNDSFYNESCVFKKKPWQIYFTTFFNIKTPIRIYLLKNQILNNLPKILSNSEELYIHIRSGNIFKSYFHGFYSQPPFCFYERVLKNFSFKKVILIAQDTHNPIVIKL